MKAAIAIALVAACALVLWRTSRAPDPGAREVAAATAPADESARDARAARGARAADEIAPSARGPADPALSALISKRIGDAVRRAATRAPKQVDASRVRVAVHAVEVGSRDDLVAIDADRAMRPASNMKLVTSAAALVLLGKDGRFETVFASSVPLLEGRLAGDLVVRAGGDPLYDHDAAGDLSRRFAALAADLRASGLVAIDGAIVLDEGDFSTPAPGPAWPAASERWKEYCALAGGFSANAGCLTATVRAREPGRPAAVSLAPRHHPYAEKKNVETTGARTALKVGVEVRNGVARVEGSIPKDVPEWSARCAVPDPVELFGAALAGALADEGIEVARGVVRERRPPRADERVLARLETPIADVMVPINTHSNNACADQLFLALGHAVEGDGTRAGGRAAVARALARLGVASEGLVQVDGSGLSRDNRVSARQITALIGAVLRLDARSARLFVDSLAVGAETGTLDDRMRGLSGRVHAKTGFIAGTSALSGLIDARDGRAIVFSILVEYPPVEGLNTSCWKPMQDAICADLAGWDG